MRRLKRSTALLQRSRNCLRGRKASRNERDYARRKSRELARSLQTSMLRTAHSTARGRRLDPLSRRDCCCLWSVLGEKLILAAVGLHRQRNLGCARTPRVQPASSTLALLSRNDAHGQDGKRYCYRTRYCSLNGEFHLAIRLLMRTTVDSAIMRLWGKLLEGAPSIRRRN